MARGVLDKVTPIPSKVLVTIEGVEVDGVFISDASGDGLGRAGGGAIGFGVGLIIGAPADNFGVEGAPGLICWLPRSNICPGAGDFSASKLVTRKISSASLCILKPKLWSAFSPVAAYPRQGAILKIASLKKTNGRA